MNITLALAGVTAEPTLEINREVITPIRRNKIILREIQDTTAGNTFVTASCIVEGEERHLLTFLDIVIDDVKCGQGIHLAISELIQLRFPTKKVA